MLSGFLEQGDEIEAHSAHSVHQPDIAAPSKMVQPIPQ
jgi:hypothetical protein